MLTRFTPESIAKIVVKDKPVPPPKKSEPRPQAPGVNFLDVGLALVRLGTSVGSAYWRRELAWRQQEQAILAAAKENQGWLTETQMLAAINFDHRNAKLAIQRLCEKELCQVYPGRYGMSVYVFVTFLPVERTCDYCDQTRPPSVEVTCPCCGAP